jgi:ribosome recycling factor
MINLILTDANAKEFEKSFLAESDKAVKHFEHELTTIRTGRAHPALVENVRVECYGSSLTLKEMCSVSVPEARLLVIQPWDKSLIGDIEKALLASDLGVTPVNDGNVIRIQLPGMSTARREELGKLVGQKLEDARIAVRNVRKDFHNLIRDAKKEGQISEDHSRRLDDLLQKSTDTVMKRLEGLTAKKEAEIKGV